MSVSPDQVTAVVLAGGFGTRIRSVLGDLPKPMAPVQGRPFVEWVLRYLAKQGIRRAVLSTGYRAEVIASHFSNQPVPSMDVRCIPETSPLGTAGGFLNAIRHADHAPGGWLVVNGDSLALASLAELFNVLNQPGCGGGLLGLQVPDASRYGTLSRDERGHLESFQEKRPGRGVINAGVYLFPPSTIPLFPDCVPLSFETEVFPRLLQKGIRLEVCVTGAPFLDIGIPEALAEAEHFVANNPRAFARETIDRP